MSFVEYVESVRARMQIPEDPVKAHWWPDVPVFVEITEDDIKRRCYLGTWEPRTSQLIAEYKESEISDLNMAAFPPRFGSAIERCGGKQL